ncbi:hypothetical protein ACFXI0_33630 [Kitasatospora indigofera]|uniref:hypothetical protein n=1 Tax=Kitasatospora indigofera TaxID=67307 RepID=UPI0036C12F8C
MSTLVELPEPSTPAARAATAADPAATAPGTAGRALRPAARGRTASAGPVAEAEGAPRTAPPTNEVPGR